MSYPSYPADPGQGHVAKPGVVPLRPLGLGDILGGAFATIRRRPLSMLGVTAAVMTVCQLVILVATYPQYEALAALPPVEETTAEDLMDAVTTSLTWTGIALVILYAFRTILVGFLTHVVGTAVIGRPQTVGQVWAAVRGRLLPLFGLTLLMFAAVAGAVLVIVVLAMVSTALAVLAAIAAVGIGIWVGILFSLAVPPVVLENAGVLRAFGRSRQLVRGSWWRVLGILMVTFLIVFGVTIVLTLPTVLADDGMFSADSGLPTTGYLVLSTVTAIVAAALTESFVAAITVLLYTDQRMRRENLAAELARQAEVHSA